MKIRRTPSDFERTPRGTHVSGWEPLINIFKIVNKFTSKDNFYFILAFHTTKHFYESNK